MYDLTIIQKDGGKYIDSRQVAEVIGKRHDHLLRDIDGYLRILEKAGLLQNISPEPRKSESMKRLAFVV